MRRFVLIVLMTLLPLQYAWAAAASICEHEAETTQQAHFGHHEHEHHDAVPAADHDSDSQQSLQADHPDCNVCHGLGSGIPPMRAIALSDWAGRSFFPPYASRLSDGFPATLLRPPLSLVS